MDLIVGRELRVTKDVPMRARALVRAPQAVAGGAQGLALLGAAIADAGFRDVHVYANEPPQSWRPRAKSVPLTFPEWLLWIEATPTATRALRVDMNELATVTDAWTVDALAPASHVAQAVPQSDPRSSSSSTGHPLAWIAVCVLLTLFAWGLVIAGESLESSPGRT